MDKIKIWLRSMSLRRAFISLILVMAIFVAGISVVAIYSCVKVQERILEEVTDYQVAQLEKTANEYTMVISNENRVFQGENGQSVILSTKYLLENLTGTQRITYYGAKVAVILIPTLLFVSGTILCAWLFYSVKLKQPLSMLLQSAERISQSDLEFNLDYPSSDEMGELCHAMDTMRQALLKSNQEAWAMMEERRKLNASIAHDLRTPITVMKGYTEYLSHNIPLGRISEAKLLETIHNLGLATERLEQYINQVREVQALDALPVNLTACPLREFFEEQEDEYSVLAGQHQLCFAMNIENLPDIQIMLDVTLVHRLIDNAISNALRFAQQEIKLEADWADNLLSIRVRDDGPGFSDEALQSAAKPFFKENTENEHFGLGLSICNTLCQKQNGRLILSNLNGACVEMQIGSEKYETN